MSKEIGRKCSKCGHNGHNTRTCSKDCTQEIKLFGVQIRASKDDVGQSGIKRSKSLDDLTKKDGSEFAMKRAKSNGNLKDLSVLCEIHDDNEHDDDGLERKKGQPWSEKEHRSFLVGLERLGKGDWKGISKNFVPSRSSSQVASHAQKHYNRINSKDKKHRRSSVFDISLTKEKFEADTKSSIQAVESSQKGNSQAAHMKNIAELGQAIVPASDKNSERPSHLPISMHEHELADKFEQTRISQSSTKPIVAYVPVFMDQNEYYYNLANYGPFMHPPGATIIQSQSFANEKAKKPPVWGTH